MRKRLVFALQYPTACAVYLGTLQRLGSTPAAPSSKARGLHSYEAKPRFIAWASPLCCVLHSVLAADTAIGLTKAKDPQVARARASPVAELKTSRSKYPRSLQLDRLSAVVSLLSECIYGSGTAEGTGHRCKRCIQGFGLYLVLDVLCTPA